MLTIWGRLSSINVQKVVWAAGEVGQVFERIDLGGSFGGNREPAFLAKNPNGQVPVLEDGDVCAWDSNSIVRYLAARYGSGWIWEEDPALRAEADRWMDWMISELQPAMTPAFWGLVRRVPDHMRPGCDRGLHRQRRGEDGHSRRRISPRAAISPASASAWPTSRSAPARIAGSTCRWSAPCGRICSAGTRRSRPGPRRSRRCPCRLRDGSAAALDPAARVGIMLPMTALKIAALLLLASVAVPAWAQTPLPPGGGTLASDRAQLAACLRESGTAAASCIGAVAVACVRAASADRRGAEFGCARREEAVWRERLMRGAAGDRAFAQFRTAQPARGPACRLGRLCRAEMRLLWRDAARGLAARQAGRLRAARGRQPRASSWRVGSRRRRRAARNRRPRSSAEPPLSAVRAMSAFLL